MLVTYNGDLHLTLGFVAELGTHTMPLAVLNICGAFWILHGHMMQMVRIVMTIMWKRNDLCNNDKYARLKKL